MDREIRIVPFDAVPRIQQIEQDGAIHILGELRDFRWSEPLRAFMPDPDEFSVSWVELAPDEILQPHTHPIQTMLVIYAGSGAVIGDLRRPLTKGDIVVVPPGCAHGFVGGPDRLKALSIQFGQGLYSDPGHAHVVFSGEGSGFEALARYNESRFEAYQRAIFGLLSDGTLDDPGRRRIHLGNLRRWLVGYAQALVAFQASAPPDVLADSRLEALPILPSPGEGDPLLEALSDWFAYRVRVLDFHEKAALLHLALGQAIAGYFRRAASALGESELPALLERLAPTRGMEPTLRLLRGQTTDDHARLQRILGEAWDTLGAMNDRMAALARAA
jgi:mannose-6-phosphate isomerase-like protein (cupin superfamily)